MRETGGQDGRLAPEFHGNKNNSEGEIILFHISCVRDRILLVSQEKAPVRERAGAEDQSRGPVAA